MATKILQAIYTGETQTGTYDAESDEWTYTTSGTNPDNSVLAPLTLSGYVYYPGANYNAADASSNFGGGNQQMLTLIYDDSNEAAIISSLQTVTDMKYFINTVDYTS